MVTAFWAGGFRSEWGREELKSVNFQWHLSSIIYFLTDVTHFVEEISLHSGCVWLCHHYLILENLRDEINEYCKVVHSEKDQLQEQYATALMVQFCFSEVE